MGRLYFLEKVWSLARIASRDGPPAILMSRNARAGWATDDCEFAEPHEEEPLALPARWQPLFPPLRFAACGWRSQTNVPVSMDWRKIVQAYGKGTPHG